MKLDQRTLEIMCLSAITKSLRVYVANSAINALI